MAMHTPGRRFTLVTFLLVFMTLIFTLLLLVRTWVDPVKTQRVVLASLFKHNLAYLEPVPIMPLGDSITAGVGSMNGSGYRAALWYDYQAAGYRVDFVGSGHNGPQDFPQQHEGHPGWRIDQLSAHIVGWLATYQPHIILLQIGTNDILQHDDLPLAPARLNNLLERITEQLPNKIGRASCRERV